MCIRLASISDVSEIMSFINSEWKEGHILARDESFFLYEHQNIENINFVISKDKQMNINGVLGFIPCALDIESDVATVIWKVSKNNENPILGIQLLQFLQQKREVKVVFSVGINKKTIGIYNYLGMFTNSLDQFVMFNENVKEFKIAKIDEQVNRQSTVFDFSENYKIQLIKDTSELSNFCFEDYKQNIPFKNFKYFSKRYFHHPIYNYDIYGAYKLGKIVGLIVARVQSYNNSEIIRMVDFIGNEVCLPDFGRFLSGLLKEKNYEYADFYSFGLDNNILDTAGFRKVNPLEDCLIIPNYFAPFMQQNVAIHFFADTDKIKHLKLFKGDGDQDRPN